MLNRTFQTVRTFGIRRSIAVVALFCWCVALAFSAGHVIADGIAWGSPRYEAYLDTLPDLIRIAFGVTTVGFLVIVVLLIVGTPLLRPKRIIADQLAESFTAYVAAVEDYRAGRIDEHQLLGASERYHNA